MLRKGGTAMPKLNKFTHSGLTEHQHIVLRQPWLYDRMRDDHRSLVEAGLLVVNCGTIALTTPKGLVVRELVPGAPAKPVM